MCNLQEIEDTRILSKAGKFVIDGIALLWEKWCTAVSSKWLKDTPKDTSKDLQKDCFGTH